MTTDQPDAPALARRDDYPRIDKSPQFDDTRHQQVEALLMRIERERVNAEIIQNSALINPHVSIRATTVLELCELAQEAAQARAVAQSPLRRTIDAKFHVEGSQIIKTPSGEVVPEDEPLWLVRARDYLAVPMLEHYVKLCELDGCTDYQLDGIRQHVEAFKQFAAYHADRMKQPGITRGAAWKGEKSATQEAAEREKASGVDPWPWELIGNLLDRSRFKSDDGCTVDLFVTSVDYWLAVRALEAHRAAKEKGGER